jgi:hypothetical protein
MSLLRTQSRRFSEADSRQYSFEGHLIDGTIISSTDQARGIANAHWTKPELVAEITYLTWGDEGLLRHTVFVGLREDKPAREVRRETPTASKTSQAPTEPDQPDASGGRRQDRKGGSGESRLARLERFELPSPLRQAANLRSS